MKRTVAVVLLAVALTTGCGGGSSDEKGGPISSSPASPTETAPAAPTFKSLSEKDLIAALLEIEALPVGYSQDPPSEPTNKTFCDYKVPHQPQTEVSRDFTKGSGLPQRH